MRFFRKREIFITLLLLFSTFIFSFLFYRNLNSSGSFSDEKEIGTITFKINSIQRKHNAQLIWRNLEQHAPLKNKDIIKTFNSADATIILKDGTEIQVSENSLIYLDLSGTIPSIRFDHGTISLKNNSNSQYILHSNDAKINLGKGSFQMDKQGDKDANLVVESGTATIQNGNETSTVGEFQTASLGKDGTKVSKVKFRLTVPETDRKIFASKSAFVNFHWDSEKEESATLQVSRNRDFSDLFYSANSRSGIGMDVPAGQYYWRVVSEGSASPIRRLNIYNEGPPDLISPKNGRRFDDSDRKVSFFWSNNPLSQNYRLDVSKSPDFKDRMVSTPLSTNSYTIQKPENGLYYWRVVNFSSDSKRPIQSPISQFSVGNTAPIKETEEKKPTETVKQEPEKPKEDEKKKAAEEKKKVAEEKKKVAEEKKKKALEEKKKAAEEKRLAEEKKKADEIKKDNSLSPNRTTLTLKSKEPIVFKWKKMSPDESYVFQLFNSRTGKLVHSAKGKNNSVSFQKYSLLEEGKFHWEVQRIQGRTKHTSKASFGVSLARNLQKLKPEEIEIISPDTIYRD